MFRFHHAFPVTDIEKTRQFYGDVMGCTIGRSAERWVDFDFFGHQLSAHLSDETTEPIHNPVDGDSVPVPHFGVILDFATFDELLARLESSNITFVIPPRVRFAGEPGEQRTMFFRDPTGNTLEIKAFASENQIFET